MSSPSRENRAICRMMEWDKGRRIMNRKFIKALNRLEKRDKSRANVEVWNGHDWVSASRRGLIHKGGKPRG